MIAYTFLKCPFCGNDPRKTYTGEGIKVMEQGGLVWCECTLCGASGPKVKAPDAPAAFNRDCLQYIDALTEEYEGAEGDTKSAYVKIIGVGPKSFKFVMDEIRRALQ